MFRQFLRTFQPFTTKLVRAVGDAKNGNGNGAAFAHNSVSREEQLTQALKRSLPGITYISIQDISGGCGAMFEVNIEAKEFQDLSIVKQHRLVTDSLKSEIAEMHGIRINTSASPKDQ